MEVRRASPPYSYLLVLNRMSSMFISKIVLLPIYNSFQTINIYIKQHMHVVSTYIYIYYHYNKYEQKKWLRKICILGWSEQQIDEIAWRGVREEGSKTKKKCIEKIIIIFIHAVNLCITILYIIIYTLITTNRSKRRWSAASPLQVPLRTCM